MIALITIWVHPAIPWHLKTLEIHLVTVISFYIFQSSSIRAISRTDESQLLDFENSKYLIFAILFCPFCHFIPHSSSEEKKRQKILHVLSKDFWHCSPFEQAQINRNQNSWGERGGTKKPPTTKKTTHTHTQKTPTTTKTPLVLPL